MGNGYTVFFAVALLILAGLAIPLIRSRRNRPPGIAHLGDIEAIVRMLSTRGQESAFVALCVPGTEGDDGDTACIQFSVEGGKVGFDFVMLSVRNIRDRAQVEALARQLRIPLVEKRMNDVNYLRTELPDPGDLARFGTRVLEVVYGVQPGQELEVEADAPSWTAQPVPVPAHVSP